MDNITHALAGLLMADATVSVVQRRVGRAFSTTIEAPSLRRFRRAAVVVGMVAAELPDIDLLYAGPVLRMGSLGYLLHHRGHTHTILWALVGAVGLWSLAKWWWQRGLSGRERADATSAIVARVGSRALLALAVLGTLSHLLLDFTNSYGVHPFWPIDNHWYYGDSIFIVEPWLMVASIPVLWWGPRRVVGRAVLAIIMALILAASWLLPSQVEPTVALVLSVTAALWSIGARALSTSMRPWAGMGLWAGVTLVFAVASQEAKAAVRALLPDGSVRDVVLTPGAADPRCFTALAVTMTAVEYRVTAATVAPWPNAKTAASCVATRGRDRLALGALPGITRPSSIASSERVEWAESWSVSRDQATVLANTVCEFGAALRFMRTPAWAQEAGGRWRIADLRFGAGGGGFAELTTAPSTAPCTLTGRWIPLWVPPREELLSRSPAQP